MGKIYIIHIYQAKDLFPGNIKNYYIIKKAHNQKWAKFVNRSS